MTRLLRRIGYALRDLRSWLRRVRDELDAGRVRRKDQRWRRNHEAARRALRGGRP